MMSTIIKAISWLLLVLWLGACSPLGGWGDDDVAATGSGLTWVRGQVLLAEGHAPVARPPRVQVWGRARSRGGLSGGGAYAPVGAAQKPDGQGQFNFSFQAEEGTEYVLRAEEGGLGYYTDWNLVPGLRNGQDNAGIRLLVYAPAWVRLDLVDEPPRSRVWMTFSGFGGGGLELALPSDTTLVFPYLTGQGKESFIFWAIKDEQGSESTYRRTFIQPPLDTQRIRIAF